MSARDLWWYPSTGWYSGNPSTTVTRVCYKHELTRDLRSLIWANVERDYHSSAPVNFAAIALQAAWRRLRAIIKLPVPGRPTPRRLGDRWYAYRRKWITYAAIMRGDCPATALRRVGLSV